MNSKWIGGWNIGERYSMIFHKMEGIFHKEGEMRIEGEVIGMVIKEWNMCVKLWNMMEYHRIIFHTQKLLVYNELRNDNGIWNIMKVFQVLCQVTDIE